MCNNLLFWPYLMPPFYNKNQKNSDCSENITKEEDAGNDEYVDFYAEPHYTTEL